MNLTSDAAFSSALSDEALASLVQQGDRAALDALIGRYRSFTEKCASRCRSVSLETDDFVQEANLALLSAAYAAGPRRIVVKRPLKGPYLGGVKPSFSLKGKAIRYDILIP